MALSAETSLQYLSLSSCICWCLRLSFSGWGWGRGLCLCPELGPGIPALRATPAFPLSRWTTLGRAGCLPPPGLPDHAAR